MKKHYLFLLASITLPAMANDSIQTNQLFAAKTETEQCQTAQAPYSCLMGVYMKYGSMAQSLADDLTKKIKKSYKLKQATDILVGLTSAQEDFESVMGNECKIEGRLSNGITLKGQDYSIPELTCLAKKVAEEADIFNNFTNKEAIMPAIPNQETQAAITQCGNTSSSLACLQSIQKQTNDTEKSLYRDFLKNAIAGKLKGPGNGDVITVTEVSWMGYSNNICEASALRFTKDSPEYQVEKIKCLTINDGARVSYYKSVIEKLKN